MPRRAVVCALVLLVALHGPTARAEGNFLDGTHWHGGAQVLAVPTRGELGDVFGTGVGLEPFGLLRFDQGGALGVRVQGSFIDYGTNVEGLPPMPGPGPSLSVQLGTKRTVGALSLGPQLTWPRGRLRPYGYATVGIGMFISSADVTGRDSLGFALEQSGSVTDWSLGTGVGGGMAFRVTPRTSLDASFEYRRYSDVRAVGSEFIKFDNGDVAIAQHRGDLDMMMIRAGVLFTMPLSDGKSHGHERPSR
jgi:opacity protein-like surface antigen